MASAMNTVTLTPAQTDAVHIEIFGRYLGDDDAPFWLDEAWETFKATKGRKLIVVPGMFWDIVDISNDLLTEIERGNWDHVGGVESRADASRLQRSLSALAQKVASAGGHGPRR